VLLAQGKAAPLPLSYGFSSLFFIFRGLRDLIRGKFLILWVGLLKVFPHNQLRPYERATKRKAAFAATGESVPSLYSYFIKLDGFTTPHFGELLSRLE
jgi:hypothetical protein